jgi:Protein kinase domain
MDSIIKPPDRLINLMKKGIKNIKYDNKTYKLLGRGGEGNVYEYNKTKQGGIAIKVYRDNSVSFQNPEIIEREFYVMRFLNDIEQIKDHIVDAKEYAHTDTEAYIFMDLYEGDLDKWAKLATQRDTVKSEEEWLSMIFQVVYTFMDINSRGVLHDDPKPKNIFYTYTDLKDPNSDGKRVYSVNGKGFEIPFTCRFALGDFSRVRVAEFDADIDEDLLPGHSGTPDLYYNLVHRTDLYELSRILYRVMVNAVMKAYSAEKIKNLVDTYTESDSDFKEKIEYMDKGIEQMNIEGKSNEIVSSMKNRMKTRSYVYELIEADYLDKTKIMEISKDLVLPSQRVMDILGRNMDPNESLETLFDFYLQ